MALLNSRLSEFISSSDSNDKLTGIWAILELTDEPVPDKEESLAALARCISILSYCIHLTCFIMQMKIQRFSSILKTVPLLSSDAVVLKLSARALGHLAQVGGTATSDFVDAEAKRALDWMQTPEPRTDSARRLAALFIICELATHASTLFYPQVASFFAHLWPSLCDSRVQVGRDE